MTKIAAAVTVFLLFSAGHTVEAGDRPLPPECTYVMQVWNVNLKSSVGLTRVRHPYTELISEEIEPTTGCTVCSEDQERVDLPPLPPFSVCFRIAPRVRAALGPLVRDGAPLFSVAGYRVIKSRGPVDRAGNRTGFSNHSFGTAVDINPEQNGFYDNCIAFGPGCRLLRGGEWRPGAPGTLESNSETVLSLTGAGFKWGGAIEGKQKDFMHFSLTGY